MLRAFKPGFRIGILGGGQLARMLALSAHNLGVVPYVLSTSDDDPAQQVVERGFLGDIHDENALKAFSTHVDVLTFESEFVNCDTLEKAVPNHKDQIFPSLSCLRILQDRRTQKELLDNFKITTSTWRVLTDAGALREAAEILSLPLVIKKRRNGYDGNGTFVIKNKKALNDFIQQHWPEESTVGAKRNSGKNSHADKMNSTSQKAPNETSPLFIAESFVDFKRELACIFSRDRKGSVLQFPLVESFQKENRCFWVKGPIEHKKFEIWSNKFKLLLKKIDYVGSIGVELFDTGSDLVVNELAPRVHNTGHYSTNALPTNQFDAHIRALSGMALGNKKLSAPGFAMVNILGTKNKLSPSWVLSSSTHLHWYGKNENRLGRKMGHINTTGSSPEAALKNALQSLKGFNI